MDYNIITTLNNTRPIYETLDPVMKFLSKRIDDLNIRSIEHYLIFLSGSLDKLPIKLEIDYDRYHNPKLESDNGYVFLKYSNNVTIRLDLKSEWRDYQIKKILN